MLLQEAKHTRIWSSGGELQYTNNRSFYKKRCLEQLHPSCWGALFTQWVLLFFTSFLIWCLEVSRQNRSSCRRRQTEHVSLTSWRLRPKIVHLDLSGGSSLITDATDVMKANRENYSPCSTHFNASKVKKDGTPHREEGRSFRSHILGVLKIERGLLTLHEEAASAHIFDVFKVLRERERGLLNLQNEGAWGQTPLLSSRSRQR